MLSLRFSTGTLASLDRFDTYLQERNARTEDALLSEVEALCSLLTEFPDLGRAIPNTDLSHVVTRKHRYWVVYRVQSKALINMNILHQKAG